MKKTLSWNTNAAPRYLPLKPGGHWWTFSAQMKCTKKRNKTMKRQPSTKQRAQRQPGFVDIEGRQFGKWTAVGYVGNKKWWCRCACGKRAILWSHSLRKGLSSCCKACHPSRQRVDLTGQRFGFLIVLGYAEKRKWLCECECGKRRKVYGPDLKRNRKHGCRRCTHLKHGASNTTEYIIWQGIKRRCLDPWR